VLRNAIGNAIEKGLVARELHIPIFSGLATYICTCSGKRFIHTIVPEMDRFQRGQDGQRRVSRVSRRG